MKIRKFLPDWKVQRVWSRTERLIHLRGSQSGWSDQLAGSKTSSRSPDFWTLGKIFYCIVRLPCVQRNDNPQDCVCNSTYCDTPPTVEWCLSQDVIVGYVTSELGDRFKPVKSYFNDFNKFPSKLTAITSTISNFPTC